VVPSSPLAGSFLVQEFVVSYGRDYPIDYGYSAAGALPAERASFIRRTYSHLAGAVLAFIAIDAALLSIPGIDKTVIGMLGGTPYSWLFVLLAFMVVGIIAQNWARSQTSRGVQYLGLALYVVAEALIFLPLLIVAQYVGERTQNPNIIPTAGILTLAVFGGLTTIVLTTKKDFTFLGGVLSILTWLALGFIVCAIIFQGINLGMVFTLLMIGLMAGWILYYTSDVLHHYPTDMHVAAALTLFAAVATLFWYILQLVITLAGSRD
jgi:FtsH-binding integral membrane protein